MLAKFFALNPKGPYVSCCGRKTTAKKCTKNRDAHAKMFFCQCKPIFFLLFAIAVAKTLYCCHPEILLPW